jgi:hypothetical protein
VITALAITMMAMSIITAALELSFGKGAIG